MTPKEKSKELFIRNFEITVDDYCAKQCALIAVDLVIENIEDDYLGSDLNFWQEVKQEINKI